MHPGTDTDELIGATVGEYQVLGRLGVGGMGVVYEGRHPVIGKRVAIKVLMPQLSAQTELVQRFLAEARAVNAIRHRGIVDIFSFGSLPSGALYFVMEYLDGESLDKLIERGAVPVGDALAIVEEVLDALAAAHEAHVIHRDIKPSNLFLVSSPRGKAYVKLLDFGIAKLTSREGEGAPQTRASVIMGTPDYIAPEQAKGAPITPQTDLYAVGVVLFELLTGFRPFRGENPLQTMWMHLEQPAPKPSSVVPELPALLDSVCLWAMQKEPAARPRSADHLREVIASLRASFARNALGSPLTPQGSPRPLSAIDGLPPELRQASSLPPTLFRLGPLQTGAQPTVLSLEPVAERTEPSAPLPALTLDEASVAPPIGDEERTHAERNEHSAPLPAITLDEAGVAPTMGREERTHADRPSVPSVISAVTPLTPPRRAPPADSTRIERPPEAPPHKAGADLTPLATDLKGFDGEAEPVPFRALPVPALILVSVAVVALLIGGWVLLVSSPRDDSPDVRTVVGVDAPRPDTDVEPPPEAPVVGGGMADIAPPAPDPGPTEPTRVVEPTRPQPLAPRVVEEPRRPARPPTVTTAALEQRLAALERRLEAREKTRGEPDRMLRKYFSRVRDDLSQAETDADRKQVQRALEELSTRVATGQ